MESNPNALIYETSYDNYLSNPLTQEDRLTFAAHFKKLSAIELKVGLIVLIPIVLVAILILYVIYEYLGTSLFLLAFMSIFSTLIFNASDIGEIGAKRALKKHPLIFKIGGHDFSTGTIDRAFERYKFKHTGCLSCLQGYDIFKVIQNRGFAYEFEIQMFKVFHNVDDAFRHFRMIKEK